MYHAIIYEATYGLTFTIKWPHMAAGSLPLVCTYITANYWCSSEECSMASIVRTIIPDYQNTNIKKAFY